MDLEGHLKIRLQRLAEGSAAVSIESNRPVHASRAFHGKRPEEVRSLMPLLFSVCATAQTCAGVRACEQALGIGIQAGTEDLRDCLLRMETLREHLWRILLDWPSYVGGEARRQEMAQLLALEKQYRKTLGSGGDPLAFNARVSASQVQDVRVSHERLAAFLRREVFGLSPGDWSALADPGQLAAWAAAEQTVAAAVAHRVIRSGSSALGACPSTPLPPMPEDRLREALEDEVFVERPRWNGQCCETSSLTRCGSDLLAALRREYGNGLLTRIVARLTEIAGLVGALEPGPDLEADERRAAPVNPGIGQAAAARGQLVHRVAVADGLITDYRILAPTEWNFHPEGVVARALSALPANSAALREQARLLIDVIDPCIGYDLEIL